MKKIIAILVILTLCLTTLAYAQGLRARSSGLKTEDAAIATVRGSLTGVLVITDGTNAASIIVYDHATAATGTVLFKGTIAGTANFGGATFGVSVRYMNGVYADIGGTGASYIIYYSTD